MKINSSLFFVCAFGLFFFLPSESPAEETSKTYNLVDQAARLVASALYHLKETQCKMDDDMENPFGPLVKECEIKNLFCYANDLGAQIGYHPHHFLGRVSCRMQPAGYSELWPELSNNDQGFALMIALEAAGIKPTGPTDGYGPEGFRAAAQYEIFSIQCQMKGLITCKVVTAPTAE